jgi:hypothetical protein
MREPRVRIRCPSPEDAERARRLVRAAGHEPEDRPGGLEVRDADPDAVNDLLVDGGARGRAVAREEVGKLLGWLVDRQGDLAGRGTTLRQLVARALDEAGLADRYLPRSEGELLAAAAALHERLLATGGAFVPWERFVSDLCVER